MSELDGPRVVGVELSMRHNIQPIALQQKYFVLHLLSRLHDSDDSTRAAFNNPLSSLFLQVPAVGIRFFKAS